MFKAFLVKYAEIGIKGKNRYLFEDALIRQMEYVLKDVEGTFRVTKEQGRIYVQTESEFDYDETLDALKRVFGIAYICPVVIREDEGFEKLAADVVEYVDHVYSDKNKTFKVYVRRAKKTYPGTSMELSADLGGRILDAYPQMHVDVHQGDLDRTSADTGHGGYHPCNGAQGHTSLHVLHLIPDAVPVCLVPVLE